MAEQRAFYTCTQPHATTGYRLVTIIESKFEFLISPVDGGYKLDLTNEKLSEEKVKQICEWQKKWKQDGEKDLIELDVTNSGIGNGRFEQLAQIPGLLILRAGSNNIKTIDFKLFEKPSNLLFLDVNNNPIDEYKSPNKTNNCTLRALNLNDVKITPKNLKFCITMLPLVYLSMVKKLQVYKDLKDFANNQRLRYLDLNTAAIDAQELEQLLSACPKLRKVYLKGFTFGGNIDDLPKLLNQYKGIVDIENSLDSNIAQTLVANKLKETKKVGKTGSNEKAEVSSTNRNTESSPATRSRSGSVAAAGGKKSLRQANPPESLDDSKLNIGGPPSKLSRQISQPQLGKNKLNGRNKPSIISTRDHRSATVSAPSNSAGPEKKRTSSSGAAVGSNISASKSKLSPKLCSNTKGLSANISPTRDCRPGIGSSTNITSAQSLVASIGTLGAPKSTNKGPTYAFDTLQRSIDNLGEEVKPAPK